MPTYIRAGTQETISISGATLNGKTLYGGNATITKDSIKIEGGDCTVSDVVFVWGDPTTVPVGYLKFRVTANVKAVPGPRSIKVWYIDADADPAYLFDEIVILQRGCVGSRLNFWSVPPVGPLWPTDSEPDDYTATDKVGNAVGPGSLRMPRIYFWDIGGPAGTPPATCIKPDWKANAVPSPPDRNSTLLDGRECSSPRGYLTGSGADWIPSVAQWGIGNDAVGVAPDELIDSGTGPVALQTWRGFPPPNTTYRASTNIPKTVFMRKPYYWMSTADHFWSKAALGDPLDNQSWIEILRFVGLPLWVRSKASTFDPNYGAPFKPLRTYEWDEDLAFNPEGDTTPNRIAYGIFCIQIEPVELILPGPQTAVTNNTTGDFEMNFTYKRQHYTNPDKGKSSLGSRIKLVYQDLYALKDEFDNVSPPHGPAAGVHELSEPILVAEAYVPRIDVSVGYKEWDANGQLIPTNGVPGTPGSYLEPGVTIKSDKFKWTQVLEMGDDVVPPDGTGPSGTGTYVDRDKLAEATRLFLAEFEDYSCQLTIYQAFWDPDDGTGLTPPTQCFWDNITYPTGRNYADPVNDREGTILLPQGYIEVVEDAD